MKILILVVCARVEHGEYEMLAENIKATWGRSATEDARIFYLWCSNYGAQDENDYILHKPEGYGMLLYKTLGFLFKHRHDEFDYIVRVNCGSYIHVARTLKYLEDKPREKFYCGQVGEWEGIRFVSGSCFILSRDLVMLSLQNIKEFGFAHIDDVAFGRFFKMFDIQPTFCQTKLRYLNMPGEDENTYHWRLRSGDGKRDMDAKRMRQLYHEHYGNI